MRTCSLNVYVNLLAFICIGLIASTLLTKAMPLKDPLPKTSMDSTPTELEMQLTTRTTADDEIRPNEQDNESGEESTTTSDTATVSMRRGSESNKRSIHQLLPSPAVAIPIQVSQPSQEEIDDLMSSSKGMFSLSELAEMQEGCFLHNISKNDVRSKSLGEKTCREVERKLKRAAPTEGSVYCPWTYKCSYDEQRYPRYLIQAECLNDYCHSGCNNTGSGSPQGHCRPISVKVKILKPKIIGSYGSGSGIEWSKHNMRLKLGCKCSSQY